MPAAPYDSLMVVRNTVQARLNGALDSLQPISGKILENSSYFSQQAVNDAWRNAQDYLAERGFADLLNEAVISGFPIVASLDPATQVRLDWTGCGDGVTTYTTPFLPSECTHPLKIWERWSNQNAEFSQTPMEKILDGLPAWQKAMANRCWEWRNNAIWMPGALMVEDFRIRYVKYLPDFVDNFAGKTFDEMPGTFDETSGTFDEAGGTRVHWFEQPVPIMRCSDGFSWFICAEFAEAQGKVEVADRFLQRGKDAFGRIFNLDAAADQRVNIRRRPHSGRGNGRSYY